MSIRAHRTRLVVTIFAVVVSMNAVLPGFHSNAAATTTRSGAYLGAYVQPSTWSQTGQKNAVSNLESALGRKLDISQLYYSWDATFPSWKEAWDIQQGRIPMISWGATYVDRINNGGWDSFVRARADEIAALQGRVMIRWFAEMDAGIYDNDEVSSPAAFIAAWRHLHTIFDNRGATNVDWVWCPNAWAFSTGEAATFYPGDAYVDWICADGYNWAPQRANSTWTPFKDVFADFYAWGAPKAPPLMVGETGALEGAAGAKGDWITGMGATLKNVYPQIKALIYFDAVGGANFGGTYDWRVDTSTSSFNAFKALAADAYFKSGTSSGGGGGTPTPGTSDFLFYDGFERGDLRRWSASGSFSVRSGSGHWGSYAGRATSAGSSTSFTTKRFPTTYSRLFTQAYVKPTSRSGDANLIQLTTSSGTRLVTVFTNADGQLMLRNHVRGRNVWSDRVVTLNTWHSVQLRVRIDGASSSTEVWLDGQRVDALSVTTSLGTAPIGRLTVGDTVVGHSYTMWIDDVSTSQSYMS